MVLIGYLEDSPGSLNTVLNHTRAPEVLKIMVPKQDALTALPLPVLPQWNSIGLNDSRYSLVS